MTIVRVALDVPLSTLFDYSLDNNIEIVPGQRVLVPFGRRRMVGVVMECAVDSALSAERIKPVLQVLGGFPLLSDELLILLRFCSDYYHYPLGVTVLSALPVRLRTSQLVTLKEAMQYVLSVSGRALDLSLLSKRKVVQHRILAALKSDALSAAQVRALSPSGASAIKALLHAGWVEMGTVPAVSGTITFNNTHTLTLEQQQAVDAIVNSNSISKVKQGGDERATKTVHIVQAAGGLALLGAGCGNLSCKPAWRTDCIRIRYPVTRKLLQRTERTLPNVAPDPARGGTGAVANGELY